MNHFKLFKKTNLFLLTIEREELRAMKMGLAYNTVKHRVINVDDVNWEDVKVDCNCWRRRWKGGGGGR